QTKDLHTADYTQLYDFLKYNQKEVDELKAKRLAKIQDPLNGLIGVPRNANLNGNGNLIAARVEENAAGHNGNQIRYYNYKGVGHFARNCTVRPMRRDVAYLQTQLLITQKEEAGIQLQAEEFDLMVAAADLDEIEEKAAKFVGDFKSLAKEADESLAKHKALELEIERLLRAVVSQDIMSVVQKTSVIDISNLFIDRVV
nr:hypothetical protein [Tanacetum cinerariifolium]